MSKLGRHGGDLQKIDDQGAASDESSRAILYRLQTRRRAIDEQCHIAQHNLPDRDELPRATLSNLQTLNSLELVLVINANFSTSNNYHQIYAPCLLD